MITVTTSNFLSFRCGRQGVCCRNWDVFLSRDITEKIRDNQDIVFGSPQAKCEFFDLHDENNPVYYARARLERGRCIFLDKDECRIFRAFGKENGNPVCQSYPFFRLKLKNRFTIVTMLSCSSESSALFLDKKTTTLELAEKHCAEDWFYTDFGGLPGVRFDGRTVMEWNAYDYMEQEILGRISSESAGMISIQSIIAALHSGLAEDKSPVITKARVEQVLQNLPDFSCPASGNAEKIMFFIRRKASLYNYSAFAASVKNILALNHGGIEADERADFEKSFEACSSFVRNYLFIKFFSNPLNFSVSVRHFWHILFFFCGFIRLYCYAVWKTERQFGSEVMLAAIRTAERNFLHDQAVFEFWGRGRKGAKDFSRQSLQELII